jgi:uncharacterized protein
MERSWLHRQRKKIVYTGLALITFLAILTVYALWIEPNRFVVTRHVLQGATSSRSVPFSFVQISDLHLKKFNDRARQIAKTVNQLDPDAVIFTGDSIDRAEQLAGFEQFLDLLAKKTPKYAIMGNWEYWAGLDERSLRQIYAARNCRLLVNETVAYTHRGTPITITGLDDLVGKPDLTKALKDTDARSNRILLMHAPAYWDRLSPEEKELLQQGRSQYALSGHTHGGQISFFGFTPLLPQNSGRYASGWYRDSIVPLYVSRGLGISVLPVRVGVIPEIAYFEWFASN